MRHPSFERADGREPLAIPLTAAAREMDTRRE
jgi:hypothetical protein